MTERFHTIAEADMLALVGELTMLRGLAGSVIQAFGFPDGPMKGLSADELEALLTRHGFMRRVSDDACLMSPVSFACMQEASARERHRPC